MPQNFNGGHGDRLPPNERRAAVRHQPTSLAYVKVGDENGGIVVNISETGLALTTAAILAGEDLLRVSLDTGHRAAPIEATGEIIWLSESKRTAGVRFVLSAETMRNQIRDWIAHEKSEGKIEPAGGGSVVFGGIEFPAESPEPQENTAEPPAFAAAVPDASEMRGVGTKIGLEARGADATTGPAIAETSEQHAPPAPSDFETIATRQELLRESAPSRQTRPEMPLFSRSLGENLPPPAQISPSREGWRMAWFALASAALAVLSFVAGIYVGRTMPRTATQNTAAITSSPAASTPAAASDSLHLRDSAPPAASTAPPPRVLLSPDTETTAGNTIEVTPPEQGSEPRWISLPQQAVSASDSIAIAVRQSVVVPEAVDGEGDRPIRLEGGRIAAAAPSLPEGISIPKNGAILRLRVTLDEHGQIDDVARVTGPAELIPVAEEIVRGWEQTPARLDGKPMPSTEDVTINFRPTPAPAYEPPSNNVQ